MGKTAKKVVGAVAVGAGAVVGFTLGWTGIGGVAAAGLMAAGGALYATGNKAPDEGEYTSTTPTLRQQGHQINVRSSTNPIKLIYSKEGVIVGVNVTYIENRNPYLYMICEIGEGEMGGIIRQDGSIWNTETNELPVSNPPLVYFDDKLWTEFVGALGTERASMGWYPGNSTQGPPSELQLIDPSYEENLRHTSYLYVKLTYDKDIFKSIPKITLKTQGLYVEEIDTTTKVVSDSCAEIIQDLLIRPSYRGGLGISKSRIDETSFLEVKNYESTGKPPSMTRNIAADLILLTDVSVVDQIKKVLDILPGELVYSFDKLKLRYLNINFEPTVMAFNEDDIASSGGEDAISYAPALGFTKRPNAVKAYYVNPDNQFKVDQYTFSDPIVITQNQDKREISLELYASVDRGWVQILSNYYLERSRLNRNLAITLNERAFVLEPLDLITISYANFGWADKLFRVTQVNRKTDATVDIIAQNETSEFYNQIYQISSGNYDETNIPDTNIPPASVRNINEYEQRQSYRLRSFTRWVLDFDPPDIAVDPFWDFAEVWMKLGTAKFINDFNDNQIPSNITSNDLTLTAQNGVLRVSVAALAPNPWLRIWDDTQDTIDPNSFNKLRFRIRHITGTFDPVNDWKSEISYADPTGLITGIADCQCNGPTPNGPWLTIDVDLQENYVSGTRWKDMGQVARVELDLFIDPFPNANTFEIDDISLGNQFAASNWKYITRSEGNYIRENVIEGDEYYIKFVSVNIWGTRENFSSATTVRRVIQGLAGAPPGDWTESSFFTNGEELIFFGRWQLGNLTDIAGFEMRREGLNFNDGYPAKTTVDNSGRVQINLPSAIPNDAQGGYNYHVAPFNNLGVFGAAYSELVDTNEPDDWIYDKETDVTFDFSTGTFVGTERYDNAGTWCLRVDHTGGNLSGSWSSPIFQFSNQVRVRKIAGNFRTATISSNFTFGAIWGPTRTFGDKDPDRDKLFLDFASLDFEPTLRAQIAHGRSSGVADDVFSTFHIQMFECEARYYQIFIDLQDPVDDYYKMIEELVVSAWRRK